MHRASNDYVEAFLDLQRLQAVAPKWPRLAQEVADVAALALRQSRLTTLPTVETLTIMQELRMLPEFFHL